MSERVGIAVHCVVCHARKKPIGRSGPLGMHLCDHECPGYYQAPRPGSLWPGEKESDFGYPCGDDGTVLARSSPPDPGETMTTDESAKREGAELLPCPFCGSAVTLTEREGFVGFTCPPESPCTGSRLYQCFHAKDRATAIAAWNRRDNSALEASNKALRELAIGPAGGFFGYRGCSVCNVSWAKDKEETHAVGCPARAIAPALVDGKDAA